MKKAFFLSTAFIFSLTVSSEAGTTPIAQSQKNQQSSAWYIGLEGGYIKHKFNPYYTPANGDSPFGFVDRSDGFELGLVGGYDLELTDRFSLLFQLRGSWNNSEWIYSLPSEPANFKFDNPFNFELSAQPTIQLSDKLGIFATIGILEGYFNEEKKTGSPTHGRYDASDWVVGFAFGGGLSYRINEALECRISYRKAIYDRFGYRDYLPSGQRKNSISDEPETESISLAFIYRF